MKRRPQATPAHRPPSDVAELLVGFGAVLLALALTEAAMALGGWQ